MQHCRNNRALPCYINKKRSDFSDPFLHMII